MQKKIYQFGMDETTPGWKKSYGEELPSVERMACLRLYPQAVVSDHPMPIPAREPRRTCIACTQYDETAKRLNFGLEFLRHHTY